MKITFKLDYTLETLRVKLLKHVDLEQHKPSIYEVGNPTNHIVRYFVTSVWRMTENEMFEGKLSSIKILFSNSSNLDTLRDDIGNGNSLVLINLEMVHGRPSSSYGEPSTQTNKKHNIYNTPPYSQKIKTFF